MKEKAIEKTGPPENCWKTIGVWGREHPRCELLNETIHCRNCEIFRRAGRKLLERELPPEYREEWTDVMSAKKDEDLPGTMSVVIFRIEEEWIALRTQLFDEIIDPDRLHSHILPHRKNPVLQGVINVHGDIQLCVSLKELLGIEDNVAKKKERRIYKRMMVISSGGHKWVFPVNEIHGIHRIHPSMFQNVPVTVAKAQSSFTRNIFKWNDRHVAFLDDELLLYSLTRSVQ